MVEEETPVSDEEDLGRARKRSEERRLKMEQKAAADDTWWQTMLRRQQFFDVVDLLKQLSTPRHVGRVWWTSEGGKVAVAESAHLLAVKDCLGQLALKIKVKAWP